MTTSMDRRNCTLALEGLLRAVETQPSDVRAQLRTPLDALLFALVAMGWAFPRGSRR